MYCYSLTLFSQLKVSRKSNFYDADLFIYNKRFYKHFPTLHKKSLERACLFRGSTGYHVLNNLSKTFHISPLFKTYILYWRKILRSTVALGSIPELPAETCKEIKASEEGQAVSGEYWFDSIVPGKTVLAPCGMETEGELYFTTERNAFFLKKMFHFTISAL